MLRLSGYALLSTFGVTLLSGCQPEIVPEPYLPTSAHDAYRHALAESGLAESALGRDWSRVADAALRSPVEVGTPFKEAAYVDPTQAFATAYRFRVARGQRTEAQLTLSPPSDWRIYVDLFRIHEEPEKPPTHVASAGEGDLRLAFEPRKDGEYVLRVQSELLRGGRCTIEIRNVASLEFPVSGRDTGAIGSAFGVPREGGRRKHHGVDIFAPRHTEVVASATARVRHVDEWELGGNIIWLEDPERNLRLYFAHLQTQDVETGTWVEAGQRIGTVGNSGNARTTPTHLHFGVYARGEGPIDPYPFLFQPKRRPREVRVDLATLGRWVRTKKNVSLRENPGATETLRELKKHTPLEVWAGASRSYRVALPDGVVGYVPASATEPLSKGIDSISLAATIPIVDRPDAGAAVIRELPSGSQVDVVARFADYSLVATDAARPEWIRSVQPSPSLSRTTAP